MKSTYCKSIPFHSLLIPAYMWLSLYVANYDEVPLENILRSGVIISLTTMVFLALAWLIMKNVFAAGIVSTLIIIFVIFYGPAHDTLAELFPGQLLNKIFMPVWTCVFIALICLAYFKRTSLQDISTAINIGSLVPILIPLFVLISSVTAETQYRAETNVEIIDTSEASEISDDLSGESEYPDIYLLIFDRYADTRTLNEVYGFDNTVLLRHLQDNGFYIANRSRANYTKTWHSLASSLNLRHLDHLSNKIGPGSHDFKPLYKLIQANTVARFFKESWLFTSTLDHGGNPPGAIQWRTKTIKRFR